MNKIYILPIEPIEQRYSEQWYYAIPNLLQDKTNNYKVIQVEAEHIVNDTTKGAFLHFAATNKYKSRQIQIISGWFEANLIHSGDKFFISDAWNYAAIAIKYMSQLLDIPIEMHGQWHAGAYDPNDILGMKVDLSWAHEFERALFNAYDFSYFGTKFHRDMFLENLHINDNKSKAIVSGQPHNLLVKQIQKLEVWQLFKEDYIVWPHRINVEKQPKIAEDLTSVFNLRMLQKLDITKEQYYKALSRAKIVFSCSLQENLGIAMMEGVLAGCIPIVPDRASYSEMYLPIFKYPSEWTENYDKYIKHKQDIIDMIKFKLENYDGFSDLLYQQKQILLNSYLNADIMLNNVVK